MSLSSLHFGAGLVLACVTGGLLLMGWVPDDGDTGVLPASVRANPASYHPVYVVYTGGGGGGWGSGK